MHIAPILSSLRRHRTAALLIVLEIALTCAIVCNAVFVIATRLERAARPSGVAESELASVQFAFVGGTRDAAATTAQDLAALRAIPGVRAVAAVNMLPFGGNVWSSEVGATPDETTGRVTAATYVGSEELVEALGLQLVAGRDFAPAEYVDLEAAQGSGAAVPTAIVTSSLAARLFPGASPLGQKLYAWGDQPQTIVGVVDRLVAPNAPAGAPEADFAMLLPVTVTYTAGAGYVLRVAPESLRSVIAAVDPALDRVDARRVLLAAQPFTDLRASHFEQDRAMAWLLTGVCLALIVVTALGIIGLAGFWVQQRTRQIGIRRALGASRSDILRYFQLENFVLATLGIGLGMALAYAINLWLVSAYGVARLPAAVLPFGAALLWLVSQLAILGPALRAAAVSPAIATRSV
jgi:putative ABC transport system permease protein